MNFSFEEIRSMPGLAWGILCSKDSSTARVVHGSHVETNDNYFVEGAWSGAFEDGEFEKAVAFFGSGAKPHEQGLLLAGYTHPFETVYLIRTGNTLFASNSLVLLIGLSGERFAPLKYNYDRLFKELYCKGKDRFQTESGNEIILLGLRNAVITPDLRVRYLNKKEPGSFANFQDYRDFLVDTVKSVFENGRSPRRKRRFEPLGSISSGYDSPACSVIAREAGLKKVVSVAKARSGFESEEDSGAEIADRLGLECIRIEDREFDAPYPFYEADFVANNCRGGEVIYASLRDHLAGKAVINGSYGDRIWGPPPSPKLTRQGILLLTARAGSSLTEFRLKESFINIFLPSIGATRYEEILRISSSEEMKQWSVGGEYDRPIPRRIVEEAGIPREMFGIHKRAISLDVTKSKVSEVLSPQSLDAYKQFCNQFHANASRTVKTALRFRRTLANLEKKLRSFRGFWRIRFLSEHFDRNIDQSLLFLWAVQTVMKRYAAASEAVRSSQGRERGEKNPSKDRNR